LDDYLKRHSLNYIIDWKYELSPLMLATLLNKTAIIEYLVFRGANIDFQNGKGKTPLMVGLE
jgi:ankyrin repeat protein